MNNYPKILYPHQRTFLAHEGILGEFLLKSKQGYYSLPLTLFFLYLVTEGTKVFEDPGDNEDWDDDDGALKKKGKAAKKGVSSKPPKPTKVNSRFKSSIWTIL